MPTCASCQTLNEEGARFCETCGSELVAPASPPPAPVYQPPIAAPHETVVMQSLQPVSSPFPMPTAPPLVAPPQPTAPLLAGGSGCYLQLKQQGSLTSQTAQIGGQRVTIGRFDASTGPVDIDLTNFPGAEHVSRRHAEIFSEGGSWKVRDIGSSNGVYVKKVGDDAFSPRVQEPTQISDGDEIALGNVMFVFKTT